MIFYRMHRVRTTTKTVRYRRWGPKPRTRIWDQHNRLGSDIKYYYELFYPNRDRGEGRCLNHVIHQFLIHAHWIILSILLILSINTINNLFFLFYIHIIVVRCVLCIRYNPSVFSHKHLQHKNNLTSHLNFILLNNLHVLTLLSNLDYIYLTSTPKAI
jgi:hypothetical protein